MSGSSGSKRKRDTKTKFYAVHIGKMHGIYHSWDECKQQIQNFPKASFKSFSTLTEAQGFVQHGANKAGNSGGAKVAKWYAVVNGRTPGVYTSWPEVQEQISGWKNPKHRSFASKAEAERYVSEATEPTYSSNSSAQEPSDGTDAPAAKKAKSAKAKRASAAKDEVELQEGESGEWEAGDGPLPIDAEDTFDSTIVLDQKSGQARYKTAEEHGRRKYVAVGPALNAPIKIYTDGSSLANGTAASISGVGVYFGPKDVRNISEPLPGPRQTNQRAELTAVMRALEVAPKDRKVIIYTDSNYAIKCTNEWFLKWRANDWLSSSRKTVENRDLISKIIEMLEQRMRDNEHRADEHPGFGEVGVAAAAAAKQTKGHWERGAAGVKFVWVKGHANDEGNNAADALATEAARAAREMDGEDLEV